MLITLAYLPFKERRGYLMLITLAYLPFKKRRGYLMLITLAYLSFKKRRGYLTSYAYYTSLPSLERRGEVTLCLLH